MTILFYFTISICLFDFEIYSSNNFPLFCLFIGIIQIIVYGNPKNKENVLQNKSISYIKTLVDFKEHFWAFIGSFAGIIAYLQSEHFQIQM
jgi:hypothetical protein